MITWLRRLMRTHALIGMPLAATYLLLLSLRNGNRRIPGAIVLALIMACLAAGNPFSKECKTPLTSESYVITDLGTLSEGSGHSWAADINNAGQIVGGSQAKSGQTHAFLWQNGTMIDLGPGDGNASFASHISNSGLIVGNTFDAKKFSHAVLWRDRKIEQIDAGGATSTASGVNDAGQVAGYAGSGDPYDNSAFLWRNGAKVVLGSFTSRRINQNGDVVGRETNPQFFTAVVYRAGELQRLSTPELEESSASAINDYDQIVGYVGEWMKEEAALWDHGQLRRLGTLGGPAAEATALNNQGQVVGVSEMATGGTHAFSWQNGRMRDLNAFVSPASRWTLTRANSINAHGQIVGQGIRDGQRRAFLLTPTAR